MNSYHFTLWWQLPDIIDPFHNTSAPGRLRLPFLHVSTKPLKSSLSLHAKILFYIWNERIKYCNRYHYEVNWSVLCVNWLLMSLYLDIKSLHPHLKVNWNVLMCIICIARRLVVDNFPWCNSNFVPFPSGTLVVRRMWNRRIRLDSHCDAVSTTRCCWPRKGNPSEPVSYEDHQWCSPGA